MGEQGRVGHRHAKGHQRPRFARLQHLEHQIVDIHRAAVVGLARGVARHLWRGGLDVVTGLGAGEDPPLTLQQLIGLQHRHRAQVVGLAALAD